MAVKIEMLLKVNLNPLTWSHICWNYAQMP